MDMAQPEVSRCGFSEARVCPVNVGPSFTHRRSVTKALLTG